MSSAPPAHADFRTPYRQLPDVRVAHFGMPHKGVGEVCSVRQLFAKPHIVCFRTLQTVLTASDSAAAKEIEGFDLTDTETMLAFTINKVGSAHIRRATEDDVKERPEEFKAIPELTGLEVMIWIEANPRYGSVVINVGKGIGWLHLGLPFSGSSVIGRDPVERLYYLDTATFEVADRLIEALPRPLSFGERGKTGVSVKIINEFKRMTPSEMQTVLHTARRSYFGSDGISDSEKTLMKNFTKTILGVAQDYDGSSTKGVKRFGRFIEKHVGPLMNVGFREIGDALIRDCGLPSRILPSYMALIRADKRPLVKAYIDKTQTFSSNDGDKKLRGKRNIVQRQAPLMPWTPGLVAPDTLSALWALMCLVHDVGEINVWFTKPDEDPDVVAAVAGLSTIEQKVPLDGGVSTISMNQFLMLCEKPVSAVDPAVDSYIKDIVSKSRDDAKLIAEALNREIPMVNRRTETGKLFCSQAILALEHRSIKLRIDEKGDFMVVAAVVQAAK